MARFLITCWPFPGHVNPLLALALALRERGHEVAFYTGAAGRQAAASENFQTFPFGHIKEDALWSRLIAEEVQAPRGWATPALWLRVVREWLAGTIPAQVADLEPLIDAWQPDVLITDATMWGPTLVLWEKRGIRLAICSFQVGCLVPGPDAPPWGPGLPPPRSPATRLLSKCATLIEDVLASGMRRKLEGIRAAYALPPMRCSYNAFTGRVPLYLIPSVREFDYNRGDLPASVRYVGPLVWNKPSGEAPPAWLDGLPSDVPWVHITEGTVHHQDPFVLRAAVRGLAGGPFQAILTTGPRRTPEELGLTPAAGNVRVEQWVSHADLLPRCSVLVTTGGAATVLASLQAGVPMVVVPTHWDKADNARRVVTAGVGVSLSPRQCTPERLRRAVEQVLAEPRFRSNARRMAALFAKAPGPRGACELLEELAESALSHRGQSLYAPGLSLSSRLRV